MTPQVADCYSLLGPMAAPLGGVLVVVAVAIVVLVVLVVVGFVVVVVVVGYALRCGRRAVSALAGPRVLRLWFFSQAL